jgi:hypothetical protein
VVNSGYLHGYSLMLASRTNCFPKF